ncbi:MAG: hypothetical protein ACHQNV_04015 [Vicinamibacteria bacterium]
MLTKKALLVSALAVLGLLTTTAGMAWDDHSCSCSGFSPNIQIVTGPCPVDLTNPAAPVCTSTSDWTGIEYKNVGTAADYIATLVTVNNLVSTGTGESVYAACAGDPTTKLGKYSCHELAVKVPVAQQASGFWIVAKGLVGKTQRQPILTSIAAKKGSCIQSLPILGLGLDGVSRFQTTKKIETQVFEGCAVTFVFDATTGQVLDAYNDVAQSDPTATCSSLITTTVDQMNVTVGSLNLGAASFGDGYVSTGSASCTCRMINGHLYCWGSPTCP